MTGFWVDAWDPSYAAAVDADGDGPAQESAAVLDPDVEVPAAAWTPMPYPADLRPPATVLLVDGVRRVDARVWTAEPDGTSYPGLAASYAAGVVRCNLRAGLAVLDALLVERGLFTASPSATEVGSGQVRYPVHRITQADLPSLHQAVQGPLAALEVRAATAARAEPDRGDLLVVDGPLRGRAHLPRAVGYVKTHRRQYLPPELTAVVTGLPPGHRTPLFRLGTSWQRFSWYLRLPGGSGAPWSGVVRVECSIELTVPAAVALADLSVVTVPRFAATAYKDPRAPQNLVPIAGLEQRLRARLGDAALLHRTLTRAAAQPALRS
ncbi:MAG: hypothetical protein GEV12_11375 [Micromonosporaceae bacterium]|nr:hypothetical protein [Micromonosporaceae bacterium]